jgi:hypothetical protein
MISYFKSNIMMLDKAKKYPSWAYDGRLKVLKN